MSTTKKNPSILLVLMHLILGFMTGGVWWIGLIIWHILKK